MEAEFRVERVADEHGALARGDVLRFSNEAMTLAGSAMDMMLAAPRPQPEASSAAAAERASDVSSDVAFV